MHKHGNLLIIPLCLPLHVLVVICFVNPTQGKNILQLNNVTKSTNTTTTYSPWLRIVKNPRATGCRFNPGICNRDFFPRIRMRCCRDRCIDVTSDPNNCGLCGVRCPFSLQCCRGLCINTRFNPFHCGRCNHRCPFPGFCIFGTCNYALPPFPFPPIPFPPRPFPPRPFPPKPFPPRPQPFPPKPFPPQPKPFPPKPFPPQPKPFPPKPFPTQPKPLPSPPSEAYPPYGGKRPPYRAEDQS